MTVSRTLTASLLATLLILSLMPSSGAAELEAVDADLIAVAAADVTASPNMAHIANVRWDDELRAADGRPVDRQGGTDLEFAEIDGRDYAVAGTYRNGLQVLDITDPEVPVLVSSYDCRVLQGDVQVFTREDATTGGTRTFVTYAIEGGAGNRADSACFSDLGIAPDEGTLFIEVTDPTAPRSVAFHPITAGTHNQTVHPSGEYMYNSNSSGCGNCIEVIDIRDLGDIREITKLATGHDSHDITFSADGTRAYSAAIDQSIIIDTTDPAAPSIISVITDPAVTLHHQMDPVTIGGREFVVINDELNGAGGNEVCPGGGLHVWETTGDLEAEPRKVGAFFTPEVTVREGAGTGTAGTVTCTSHVFRIYEAQQRIVIGWFGAGVHVLDISGLADLPVAGSAGVLGQSVGVGIVEDGFIRFPDSDTWSAKVNRWEDDGSAYIFADDQTRGFDVYRYDAGAAAAAEQGTWVTPVQAVQRRLDLLQTGFVPSERLICDLTL
jgi:hypothetical protein